MISQHFIALAVAVPLAGFADYAYRVYRGWVPPDRMSWAMWAAAPLIAGFAELAQGAGVQAATVTFALGAGPVVVFAASFTSQAAHWRLRPGDYVCGAISAAALAAWVVTGTGTVAIVLAIAADLAAAVPTVGKSWRHPDTENWHTFAASGTGAGIALLALPRWEFAACAFQLYVVFICALITVLVVLPRRQPARRARPRAGSTRIPAAGAAAVVAAVAATAVAVVLGSSAAAPGYPVVATGAGGVSSGPPRVGFVVAVLRSGQSPHQRRGRKDPRARGPALVPVAPPPSVRRTPAPSPTLSPSPAISPPPATAPSPTPTPTVTSPSPSPTVTSPSPTPTTTSPSPTPTPNSSSPTPSPTPTPSGYLPRAR